MKEQPRGKLKHLWQRKPPPAPKPTVEIASLFDRQPPHSPEAEMALLGSVILEPARLAEVGPLIGKGDAFYFERHQKIWEAIQAAYAWAPGADLIPVADRLRRQGDFQDVGGAEYLIELAEAVPSAANASHYAQLVYQTWRLRLLIVACGEAIYDAMHATDVDAEKVLKSAVGNIAAAVGVAP
jgi:replicative DNA helicase